MEYAVRQRPRTFALLPIFELSTGLPLDLRVCVVIQRVYSFHKLLLHVS